MSAERRLATTTTRPGRPGPTSPAPAAPKAAWGDEFEVRVNLEINRPEAEKGRYRRPYVAVWVEDKDGFPVRNLTLWVSLGGSGPFQWLPDLKRWYGGDKARKRVDKTEMVLTISRPTRPPGQIYGRLGRQGRPRQAAPPRRIHPLHRRRP